jgi:hypothetical protein
MSKKVKVSKQFLLDGHKDACKLWKERIEKEVPELFEKPELKVGEWYSYKSQKCVKFLFNHQKKYGSYGFSDNEWNGVKMWNTNLNTWPFPNNVRKATNQEVEAALIKEAKKRGYMEAFSIKDLSYGGSGIIEVGCEKTFKPYPSNDLWLNNANENVCIFRDGKWASIIPDKEKNASLKASVKALEEQLKELKRQIG